MITVIAVGKGHEASLKDAITRYEKRLKKPFDLQWVLLPHSVYSGVKAAQDEAERIEKDRRQRILQPLPMPMLQHGEAAQCIDCH